MKKLVIFGAGPIGRMLAYEFSGQYESIVFVDVSEPLIEQMNYQKEFGITVLGDVHTREEIVHNILAISGYATDMVSKHICDAELVLTAVGIANLKFIAPVIAKALEVRIKQRGTIPLFLVACENATEQNSSLLREQIFSYLSEEHKIKIAPYLFSPDCMIDRVSLIPVGSANSDMLHVLVEQYFQLVIAETEVQFPSIPQGVRIVTDLNAVKKQKLFTVNAVHALIAYYGFHFGYSYIHEALADARIESLVTGVLGEVETALLEYGISETDQQVFAAQVLARFRNKNLNDSVARVARDPVRKAGRQDRLLMPAFGVLRQGGIPPYLASGLAALYLYNNPDDDKSQMIAQSIKHNGFADTVELYSGLSKEDPLFKLIEPPFYMGTHSYA